MLTSSIILFHLFLKDLEALGELDAPALAPTVRLSDVDYGRVDFVLLFFDDSYLDVLFAFVDLFLIILLDLMHITRPDPCGRKEVIVIWKLLLTALEVDSERVLSSDIVHA